MSRSEAEKAYYVRNREQLLEKSRAYRKLNGEHVRARDRAWYHANPEKAEAKRYAYYLRKYGLTKEGFKELLNKQAGACAVCQSKEWRPKGIVVDHDHETGRVRGLLCGLCNTGIGQFRDSIGLLVKAAGYLGRIPTREEWLQGIISAARPYFKAHGAPLPENIAISTGWCNVAPNALAGGLYLPDESNGRPDWEILVNPDVAPERLVVCVVLHELIHIAAAPYPGHRGQYREIATAFGFGRVLAYTSEEHGPPAEFLDHLMDGLGPYPHRRMT